MSAVTAAAAVGRVLPDYPGREVLQQLLRPVVEPLAQRYAGHHVQRLLGFWLCWHVMGGLDGLLAAGHWSRAGVYRNRREFLEVFGVEVEVWAPHLALALVEAEKAQQQAAGHSVAS
jgi:hypothetical protein